MAVSTKTNIFCFFKEEINYFFEFYFIFNFFSNVSEKTRYFNTRFVSYNVNI